MHVTLSSVPNILNILSIFLTAISFQTLETFITLISKTNVFRTSSQAISKNAKVDGIRPGNLALACDTCSLTRKNHQSAITLAAC